MNHTQTQLTKEQKKRRVEVLDRAFGTWKNRDDSPDSEEIRKSWDRKKST